MSTATASTVLLADPPPETAASPTDNCDPLDAPVELKVPPWLVELPPESARTHITELPRATRVAKRVLDVLVAGTLLVLTLPIMLVAAVAIKLTSPGPVIFYQTRVGLNRRRHDRSGNNPVRVCRRRQRNFGRPFTIFKLRTMHVAVDTDGPRTAQQGDDRVFRVGRFLRRTRIDELPQLINVLRGEMSMVGPRPECIDYMEDLTARIPNYTERLRLKPGLTGIAQIEAGYANDLDSYRRKIALDLMYLRNCTVQNDVKIMLRTGKVMLTGFGAL